METCEEHTHETDAGEVIDAAHLPLILHHRDAELIPVHTRGVAVTELHTAGAHVGDEAIGWRGAITIGIKHFGRDTHLVLVVALILVEGIVEVDVLYIGATLITSVVGFRLLVGIGRVSLGVVDALITVEDALLLLVEVTSTEVVVVVAGRVVLPCLPDTVVGNHATHGIKPLTVGTILAFLLVVKAVEAHILQLARTRGGGKGIGLGGLLRNLTPLGRRIGLTAIDRHAALVELLTVAEDIFRHLTEVEVEVATIVAGRTILTGVDEGIEQPELDILDIGLLEIVGVEAAHHTAPLGLGLLQTTVGRKVTSQVIGSTLLWIVGQIQHVERSRSTVVCRLTTVGVEFLHVDFTHVVVRQLVEVALDVRGGERGVAAGEDGIDAIPCQQSTVHATTHAGLVGTLREHRRHTRQGPLLRFLHTEVGLRVLKVVDIRSVVLGAASCTTNQLGKLTGEGDVARFFHMEEGYLIEHRGEPLTLLFPVHTQAPEGITQRFVTHRHLRGQSLFVEVHQRTRHLEVLREVVLPVHTHHRLALHAVFRVRLQTHTHVRPGIDDALVQDGHLTS